MSDPAWYQEWFNSVFYHKLYFERDEDEARRFINSLVDTLKPAAGSRMLDVACGRGRHSRILAEKKFQVTGIDLSPNCIGFARQWENESLDFFVHDMRLPFRVNYFDYAFNLFSSFGYFNTLREHDDVIRTIASGLKKGGVFVIDYLNVHYAEEHLVPHEEKIIDDTTYEIHRWHDAAHFYKKITLRDAGLPYPVSYTEKLAKFSLGDFMEMLSYRQLQVQDVFGDYQLGHYHLHTKPRLILVARK
jgi:SAM-dependent methyltransferase